MYLRSSLRMSSVRMKTMLGLAVSASAWVGMLPERPKESSATKATEANDRMIFCILLEPLLGVSGAEGTKVTRSPPLLFASTSPIIIEGDECQMNSEPTKQVYAEH